MHLSVTLKLILSLFLGIAIGLERESYERRTNQTPNSGRGSLGIRSYALITTLGTVAAFCLNSHLSLFLLISVTFSVLLVSYYILNSLFTKDHGLTTELAILWSYLIGVFIGLEFLSVQLIVAMTVGLILILSLKSKIKTYVAGIKEYELNSFIGYAIIALVILPFLPNVGYTLENLPVIADIARSSGLDIGFLSQIELINPFNIWRVVVIFTGVEVFGYILEKTLGQKSGWLLTSFVGGFISSTSTTQSLAQQSRTGEKNTDQLVAAALFANLASFFQHFILLASINIVFLISNIPYIFSLIVSSLIISGYFLRKQENSTINLTKTKDSLKQDKIFSLKPALTFALIFLVIKIVTKLSLVIFGQSGFIISNIFGALTGLDAVTFNIAEMAGQSITFYTGVLTLILANAVNLLSKSVYAFLQGSRAFAIRFSLSATLIIISSLASLIFLIN